MIDVSWLTLDWIAFAIGIAGTIIWVSGKAPGWESPFWIVSAGLWMLYSQRSGQTALVIRDLIGISLYCFGMWRSLIKPMVKNRRSWLFRRTNRDTA